MKMPTIIGLILVVAVVGGVIFFSEQMLRGNSQASGSVQPMTVETTNISDTSFTVSWTTQTPATGALEISSSLTKRFIAYDERDSMGKLGKYANHSVPVKNAEPNTQYSIRILSNGKSYADERINSIRTPSTVTPVSGGLEPAYGMIRTSDGLPAEGALVYITIEGGQMLSALTKASGSWLIPLNLARTQDLSAYLPTVERMTEHILVRLGSEEITATADTLNDSPIPEMTMGKTYDFRKLQAKTTDASQLALRSSPSTSPASPSSPVGGSVLGTQTNKSSKVSLIAPKEGAALPTTLPLVTGTGIPNAIIAISLGITHPISGSTKVAADGSWNFTPPKRLAPGKQSVTISTTDEKGKPIAITHTFEILKSGTQVLGDATPSATLTPIATLSATETPIVIPTSTLAGEPVPTSGSVLPTILLILLSCTLLFSGAIAFVK